MPPHLPDKLVLEPPPSQFRTAVHETPLRSADLAALREGTGWSSQAVPFHRIPSEPPSVLVFEPPTAWHAVVPGQETAAKLLAATRAGAGTVCNSHAVPFQTAAAGTWTADAFSIEPTASHALGDAHETPDIELALSPVAPGTF